MSLEEIQEKLKKVRLTTGDPLSLNIFREMKKYRKLIKEKRTEKDKMASFNRLKWLIEKYEKNLR